MIQCGLKTFSETQADFLQFSTNLDHPYYNEKLRVHKVLSFTLGYKRLVVFAC